MWLSQMDRSKGSRSPRRVLVVFLSLALLIPLAFPSIASAGDVAVIVRPDVPADDLSFNEVRNLVLGDRQFWDSNTRLTLLIQAPAAREREVLLKIIYQMTEAQFRQYWISKVFRAEAAAGPKIVYSNQMAIQLVGAIPGSIAFIDASEVPKGLKVLKVDGKLPGEKGYPLH